MSRAACTLLCLGLAALPPALRAAEQERLAVVDVSRIFKNYKKVADVEQKLNANFEARRKKLEDEAKALKDVADRISNMRRQLPPDSELLYDTFQSFQKKQFLYEKALKQLEDEIQKRYAEEMRDVLNEIRAAIRVEAEARGYTAVMRTPYSDTELSLEDDLAPAPETKEDHPLDQRIKDILMPGSASELIGRFHRNPVLFGAKTSDVTEPVLKRLNDEYEKRGAQPGQ